MNSLRSVLLAGVTKNATSDSDLDAVAEVVGRLRLDGRVMDMATFAALVLRGEIATLGLLYGRRHAQWEGWSLGAPHWGLFRA
jgi:hypothetical protein